MRSKMELLGGYLNGLNLNPLPLEFGQSLTTTKELALILSKIDSVISFTNEWYDNILNDLEGEGLLYAKLSEEFLSSFGADITAIQNTINSINSNITSLSDLITLLQYKQPSLTLTTSSTNYLYSIGETINSVMLNFNIIKGTNNLVKAEIYKNDTLLITITNILNGSNSYVDGNIIDDDTTYYIKLYDDKGFVQSNSINFNFVYKAFYGKVTNGTTITDSLIQSLTNVKFNENFSFNVSLNDEKIIIVSHDLLKSIIDSDNYDMIESFTLSTITLNINNINIDYNVYISSDTILDSNILLNIEK